MQINRLFAFYCSWEAAVVGKTLIQGVGTTFTPGKQILTTLIVVIFPGHASSIQGSDFHMKEYLLHVYKVGPGCARSRDRYSAEIVHGGFATLAYNRIF